MFHGPDQPGLVAKASSWIFERGSNIDHADPYKDPEANVFFQRVERVPSGDPEQEADAFKAFAESSLKMNTKVVLNTKKQKLLSLSQKLTTAFDIILRFQANEMSGELACIISNHKALEKAAITYGIPFYHTPFDNMDKASVEAEQLLNTEKAFG